MVVSYSSEAVSSGGPETPPKPALLKTTSRRPKRSTAVAMAACTCFSSTTLHATAAAESPSSRASASPTSAWRSAMTTRAPSATNFRTVAAPIPLAPPVTTATLPSSLPMRASLRNRAIVARLALSTAVSFAPKRNGGRIMGERVKDKVAIIFGGGQTPGETIGNGRAAALILAKEGAKVLVVDRHLGSAEDTATAIREAGGEADAFAADIMREADVIAAIAQCVSRFGRVDILHNNVGASLALGDAPATDLESDAFDRLYQINLRGMWYACKHAIPIMREQESGDRKSVV